MIQRKPPISVATVSGGTDEDLDVSSPRYKIWKRSLGLPLKSKEEILALDNKISPECTEFDPTLRDDLVNNNYLTEHVLTLQLLYCVTFIP